MMRWLLVGPLVPLDPSICNPLEGLGTLRLCQHRDQNLPPLIPNIVLLTVYKTRLVPSSWAWLLSSHARMELYADYTSQLPPGSVYWSLSTYYSASLIGWGYLLQRSTQIASTSRLFEGHDAGDMNHLWKWACITWMAQRVSVSNTYLFMHSTLTWPTLLVWPKCPREVWCKCQGLLVKLQKLSYRRWISLGCWSHTTPGFP